MYLHDTRARVCVYIYIYTYIYIYKDSFWLALFRAARPDLSEKLKLETCIEHQTPLPSRFSRPRGLPGQAQVSPSPSLD